MIKLLFFNSFNYFLNLILKFVILLTFLSPKIYFTSLPKQLYINYYLRLRTSFKSWNLFSTIVTFLNLSYVKTSSINNEVSISMVLKLVYSSSFWFPKFTFIWLMVLEINSDTFSLSYYAFGPETYKLHSFSDWYRLDFKDYFRNSKESLEIS